MAAPAKVAVSSRLMISASVIPKVGSIPKPCTAAAAAGAATVVAAPARVADSGAGDGASGRLRLPHKADGAADGPVDGRQGSRHDVDGTKAKAPPSCCRRPPALAAAAAAPPALPAPAAAAPPAVESSSTATARFIPGLGPRPGCWCCCCCMAKGRR